MRSILALDLGTTTGFAVLDRGKIISGTKSFKPRSHEGAGMRYLRFRREFLDKLTAAREVYFEQVRRHDGTDAAHVYGGLMAALMGWCEENNIPYRGVGVGEIKKHWTGKGNANKAAMIKIAVEKGYKPIDDNEADALALLDYARVVLK